MSYVKTEWSPGDIITSEKLNNAESGIETNSLAIGDIEELTEDNIVDAVIELETSKADNDGSYEQMTVGNAEQLVSNVFITDEEPYFFRTSGGFNEIGDREFDTLVGGSLGWNQLLPDEARSNTANGITYTRAEKSPYILNGTATANAVFVLNTGGQISAVAGHKFFMSGGKNTNVFVQLTSTAVWGGTNPKDTGNGTIANVVQSGSFDFALVVNSGTTVTNESVIPQLIDLTTLFSATIADYVYSLEQANAGDGVAWVKKYLPNDYYEHSEPTMKHVEGVSTHVTTGFNQCDGVFEFGNIDATGQDSGNLSYYIRTKNYTKVFGNTSYCFYFENSEQFMQGYLLTYDNDKNIINREMLPLGGSSSSLKDSGYAVVALGTNVAYVRMFMYKATDFANINSAKMCINLHWDGERDGEYEPYEEHSYPIDDTWVGMGIPKLDSANKLYFDGDRYSADGTVTERFNVITLTASESYSISIGTDRNRISWNGYESLGKTNGSFMCDKLTVMPNDTGGYGTADWEIFGSTAAPRMWITVPSSIATVSDFKTYITNNPITVVYEKSTPTTAEAEPFTNPQIVSDWGTEEYVTTGLVPIGHTTKYPANLKAKLEMAPNSPSGDGEYIVKQEDGENSYIPLIIPKELPDAPTTDGTYTLKCTVASGEATYSWGS